MYLEDSLLEKLESHPMLHHVRLYFTDRYMMYLCNLQNVSKEHLGKHMENHALSTEHERKKTWTKEQLLLRDHRPTRALKKWKEGIDWLMLMRKQPCTWWGGWQEITQWWTATTMKKKKKTLNKQAPCVTWEAFHSDLKL